MRAGLHGVSAYGAGTAVGVGAAVLFGVGTVLQHEAALTSVHAGRLHMRRLVAQRRWLIGQGAVVLATGLQVVALALAPVSIVQPLLALGLVVALAVRSVRDHRGPTRAEVLGVACTAVGLAGFLVGARPVAGPPHAVPSWRVVTFVVVGAVALVGLAMRVPAGPLGALASGTAAGAALAIAAVLVNAALKALENGGLAHLLRSPATWGAVVAALASEFASQQAFARGSLSWSLPALSLADPLVAVPVARLLVGEHLAAGRAFLWLPSAALAVVGVLLLARTPHGDPPDSPGARSTLAT